MQRIALSISLSLLSVGLAWASNGPVGKAEKAEDLTIAVAIAKSNRNNPTLYQRRLQLELSEMTFRSAWEAMFLPTISLNATTSSAYSVGQLEGSSAHASLAGAMDHGLPTNTQAQLSIGSYTIFNFGRDKDTYDIAKLEIERARQSIREAERQVRFDVISKVFNMKTQQDLLDIAQRSVDAAQAVYELIKSRVAVGKATENDVASAEVDLLNAKNELITAQTSYSQALWQLNVVLGDPIDHAYNVKASIRYIKFLMSLDDVIRIFKENSPAMRDARKALDAARLSQSLAEKNALPLPTITFSGITIGTNFGARETTINRTTTNSGNFSFNASLNFTVPLTGSGGLFGTRTLRAAQINTELAELALITAGNSGEADIRNQYTTIVQAQSTIENNEKLFKESLKVFEAALQQLQTNKSFNRLDLKDAIRQLRQAEQQFTSSVLSHYSAKLSLANAIGVDRFPEENL